MVKVEVVEGEGRRELEDARVPYLSRLLTKVGLSHHPAFQVFPFSFSIRFVCFEILEKVGGNSGLSLLIRAYLSRSIRGIRIGKVWWNGLAQSWGWLLVNCLPQLTISGVFGVEVVACLRWCLKYHISWDKTSGLQMHSIPKFGSLPCVHDAGVVVRDPFLGITIKMLSHQAILLLGGIKERWEKEIAWMALQGINSPLVQVSAQYVAGKWKGLSIW
ncbi:uncharacterized protein LOC120289790 [Eucalyptus grandis]|uniref:uncharacterized protein LOC120289790 n=1 Tax=Eucalyptus grandis TaxID=71139 RepID=UPI00192E7F13|nr:uncharacterized protein LOC120289790 [Eucalyptus grandis]